MRFIYILFFLFTSYIIFAQSDTVLIKDPLSELYINVSDSNGCVPMEVSFTPSVRQDIIFHWDFGDGETSKSPTPRHTYIRAGKYSVNLIAYYEKDSVLFSKQDWINVSPVAYPNFNVANKCICSPNGETNFLNNSNSLANFRWVFEGGEPYVFDGFNPPPIRYRAMGSYNVSLISTTAFGCVDTLTIENSVRVGMKADFVADKYTANCPPFPVSFMDKSVGCITKWKWDFGDGTPFSYSRDPVHIYSKAGDYTVRLYVSSEESCIDSLVQTDLIHVGGPLAYLEVEPLQVCEEEAVYFGFSGKGYILLEFAPGEIKLLKGTNDIASVYVHHFKNAGTYLPMYTVIDSSGCLNKFVVNDSIKVLPRPNTDFTASSSFGKKPLSFSLSANTHEDFQYRWSIMNFKDTLESTDEKPNFTLNDVGRYTAQMIAFHPNGCADTVVKKEFIAILPEDGGKNTNPTAPISATIVSASNGSEDLNVTINSVEKNTFSIAVMNEGGKVVSAQMFSVQGLKSTLIKTNDLPSGIYNILIKTKEGNEVLEKQFSKN